MRYLPTCFMAFVCVVGCGSTSNNGDGNIRDRQDQALRDPFNYGPTQTQDPRKPTRAEPVMPSRNDSAKDEWDRFWNP